MLEYARDGGFDTIVIGATGEGILQRVLFGEIPETIGEEFDGTVVMTRKHRPVQSALKRFVRKWVGKGARATDLGSSTSGTDA
ncbi:universal stress protein [Halosolutus gelatinilyticus]|uniref:universal stress protein n=1 Tax=Halosolutus gelatinilyticus TaxID=2931975 RepID=UPI001FF2E8BB|nr:universal stress protein [Halosolutus gelatinilyticus]